MALRYPGSNEIVKFMEARKQLPLIVYNLLCLAEAAPKAESNVLCSFAVISLLSGPPRLPSPVNASL